MKLRNVGLFSVLAALTLAGTTVSAQGTDYPNRPVQLLVGYPPGGASDIVARLLAQELSKMNSQPFVVENKPGVGGMLSMSMIAKAPADGYTLGLGVSGTLTMGPHLQKQKLYNATADFAPVSGAAKTPMVLLAGPSFQFDNVQSLIREAKARPDAIMYASGAQAFELTMQLFRSHAKVQLTSVPYPGGAAASMDVMGGRVPVMVDTIGAQQANIKSGKLRALAVLDNRRSSVLPDVPTMQEAGVQGYEAMGWTNVVAPKNTPAPIVQKLNRQIRQILELPEVKQKLHALGFEPWQISPGDLEKTIATEYAKWGDVVRTSGMTPQ